MDATERYIVTIDGKEHDLKVQLRGDGYFVVSESTEYQIQAEKLGPDRFLIRIGASAEEAIINRGGGTLEIFLGGQQFSARVEPYGLAQLRKRAGAASGDVTDLIIKTPMPGLVLATEVKPGDEVKKDQTLIIIEAMKMENMIKAPVAGRVKAVFVKAGRAVERNDMLVELE